MEDSGVTSFSSSGSVDLSLGALEISSSNPNEMSAVTCSDSTLVVENPAAVKVETASPPPHSPSQPEAVSPVQAEGELQR